MCAGKSSQWKGTVLDQVPVNPSLYLIKYDGFDCIYGLELYGDERVVGLEVLPDRVGEEPRDPPSPPVLLVWSRGDDVSLTSVSL